MSRKQLVLLVAVLSLVLVIHIFAGPTQQYLRTSGILTGFCNLVFAPGAYPNGLGNNGGAYPSCYLYPDGTGPSPLLIPMPSGGGLTHLVVTAHSQGVPAVVTLMVNGSATALTCTLPAATVLQSVSCADKQDLISVSQGDLVGVFVGLAPNVSAPPNGVVIQQVVVSLDRKAPVDADE